MIRLTTYCSELQGPFLAFWKVAFAGRRCLRPLTAQRWQREFVEATAFDPEGLFLAVTEGTGPQVTVVGAAHALRPPPQEGVYRLYHPRHHLAWLMVLEDWRGQGIGSRLLRTLESWLYYCPVYIGSGALPLYGTVEGPRPPLFGSSHQLGLSLQQDRALIDWLARRGYGIVEAGDVSLTRALGRDLQMPGEPDWEGLGLSVRAVGNGQPWRGAGYDELRLWVDDDRYPYEGLVLVDREDRAVGRVVWYPLSPIDLTQLKGDREELLGTPGDNEQMAGPPVGVPTAAIARLDVAEAFQGRRLGSYLLDQTLFQIARAGYPRVEVHTHIQKHARAFAMYRRRRFEPEAGWAQLVKH